MAFRYYYADRIREKLPQFKGTDEELQAAIDEISLLYNSAIRVLETRIKIISDDFDKKHSYMPIHHYQSRLKAFDSIIEKAERYAIEDPINNLDVVKREILDIAGLRVVCNYEEDLIALSYRSLHVVVAVPVYLVNTKKMVPVEVQFRSITMDAWASLEHELRYKNKGELAQDIEDTLKDCADILHDVDERMSRVRHEVLKDENKYSDY